MGVLTDIFVANKGDLAPILKSGPQSPVPVLESKGVDGVQLATLATILMGADLR